MAAQKTFGTQRCGLNDGPRRLHLLPTNATAWATRNLSLPSRVTRQRDCLRLRQSKNTRQPSDDWRQQSSHFRQHSGHNRQHSRDWLQHFRNQVQQSNNGRQEISTIQQHSADSKQQLFSSRQPSRLEKQQSFASRQQSWLDSHPSESKSHPFDKNSLRNISFLLDPGVPPNGLAPNTGHHQAVNFSVPSPN